jgi:hypothetical protein
MHLRTISNNFKLSCAEDAGSTRARAMIDTCSILNLWYSVKEERLGSTEECICERFKMQCPANIYAEKACWTRARAVVFLVLPILLKA